MQNSSVLAVAALILSAFGIGFMIQECRHHFYEGYETPPQPTGIDVNINEPHRSDEGFRYRGLLLDINVNDGGSVNLGPQHMYRMGYHDGYYRYTDNIRYRDNYRYREGYIQGERDRMNLDCVTQ